MPGRPVLRYLPYKNLYCTFTIIAIVGLIMLLKYFFTIFPLLLITSIKSDSLETLFLNAGYSKIALHKMHGALYAQGSVDSHPVYFLIDTGSTKTSILSDGVETLGLVSQNSTQKVANMTGDVSYAQNVILREVMLGGIHLGTLEAKVMQQPFKHDKPTLVIGNDIFERYQAILDIGNQALYLNKNIASRKELFEIEQYLVALAFYKIPLTRLWSGHLTLPVQCNNEMPISVLCDTGTSHTTFSNAYVQAHTIYLQDQPQTAAATDGTITYAEIALDTLTLNPLQVFYQKPIVSVGSTRYAANIDSMSQFLGVLGILGLADLESSKSIILFPTQTLYISSY